MTVYILCNETQDLKHGAGTRDMMNTALAFVKNKYGEKLAGFQLHDVSNIVGRVENLFCAYIALHGMTWYEKYYGAKFSPRLTGKIKEQYILEYNECLQKMTNNKYKQSINVVNFQSLVGIILSASSRRKLNMFYRLFSMVYTKPEIVDFI